MELEIKMFSNSMSSLRRMQNDIQFIKDENERKILPESYYCVHIHTTADVMIPSIVKKFLSEHTNCTSIYYTNTLIILFFPKIVMIKEEYCETHQCEGDYDAIISRYASIFTKMLPNLENIVVRIITFKTSIKAFSFLALTIVQTSHEKMMQCSKDTITHKELQFRTESELLNMLDLVDVDWKAINPAEKYGVLIAPQKKQNKTNFITLSEPFDARNANKYTTIMFG